LNHIINKKHLYSKSWNQKNDSPWNADHLVDEIVKIMRNVIPIDFILEEYFTHKNVKEFIETRAFPVSTFNIRPQNYEIDGKVIREPCPAYIKDLVEHTRNSLVVYVDETVYEQLPYPFNENGKLLGKKLAKYLNWTDEHSEYLDIKMKGVIKK
jgi:hypothetical protein